MQFVLLSLPIFGSGWPSVHDVKPIIISDSVLELSVIRVWLAHPFAPSQSPSISPNEAAILILPWKCAIWNLRYSPSNPRDSQHITTSPAPRCLPFCNIFHIIPNHQLCFQIYFTVVYFAAKVFPFNKGSSFGITGNTSDIPSHSIYSSPYISVA